MATSSIGAAAPCTSPALPTPEPDGSQLADRSSFGLSAARLTIAPGATFDSVAFDALVLVDNATAAFDGLPEDETGNHHPLYYAGMSLLRQARIMLEAAQLNGNQAKAVAEAGWAA
jgi:hypothetical protein